MARVFYDLAAKAGKYTDRDGNEKHRYQKMGKLVVEDDGRMWGILEVLGLETNFSVFPQQDRSSGGGQSSGRDVSQRPENRGQAPASGGARPAGHPGMDDDIPFGMEWR